MRILTSDEVRQTEQLAIARPGMSTLVLMQRAGAAVAQFCLAHFKFRSVCVVCGKGNNGGDGLVAAEALRPMVEGISVIILAPDVSRLSPEAAAMCSRLQLEPIWIDDETLFESNAVRRALSADLIIDAVFGTGFKPPLRGLGKRAVEAINDAFGTVVSIDLPSGIDADMERPAHESGAEMVFAHGIITMIAPKPAHIFGELTSGPIAVSELGVQPVSVSNKTGLQVITGQEVEIAFPPRPRDAHKGTFGHVLVIAGSLGKAGAAGLAGLAALRAGAGLVTVACPSSIQATVSSFAPELMTERLAETSEGTLAMQAMGRLEELLASKDAVVVGPGLSQNPETAECVRRLVTTTRQPLVLDADGLNAFDGHYNELKPAGKSVRVLTPHPGEAARLLGISTKDIQVARTKIAQDMARHTGACVVLKGSRTIVAGPSGETWINMSGNPAMAKGGGGDVLSGIVAAALAGPAARSSLKEKPAGGPDPVPPKGWMHEVYGVDSRDQLRKAQAKQLQRASEMASAYIQDVSVAAAVHLHGLAGDFARDMLHEHTVLAGDLLQHLAEGFRDSEQQFESGLFYLQK